MLERFPVKYVGDVDLDTCMTWDDLLEATGFNGSEMYELLGDEIFDTEVHPFFIYPSKKRSPAGLRFAKGEVAVAIKNYPERFTKKGLQGIRVLDAPRSRDRIGRPRDAHYEPTRKICLPLLKADYKKDKSFRSAGSLWEHAKIRAIRDEAEESKGDSYPTYRTFEKWLKEWKREIQEQK